MKILKISIKNYRSCKSTIFTPHQELTALIGPNGSGKTNTLSALRLLSLLLDARRMARLRDDEIPSSTCELRVWYDWNGNTIIHTAKINLLTNEKNADEVLSSDESWYMFDVTGNRKKATVPLEALRDMLHFSSIRGISRLRNRSRYIKEYLTETGFGDEALTAMLAVTRFIENMGYYSASQFTNPSSCPISFEVESDGETALRRGISIRGHKRLLYDMYQENKENSDTYNEFIDIVGPYGIGLIDDLSFNEVQTSSSNYNVRTGGKVTKVEKINLLIVPGFSISGNTLSPSQLSEGTFKTLALIFYLITDKSSMLMIEEPEVCVHHGLLNSIVELIKIYSHDKQIFISTHSDSVLDNLDMENVFAVRKNCKDGTSVSNISKSMKKNELAALKEYLLSEGSLGEFWKHGDLENV